jgi:AcrR family transcriptional regulator
MIGPRERMVISAALLMREKGARPTAIADVLEHSGAPKGSAYHYFPGGRSQLLCEAVDYAADYVAEVLGQASTGTGVLDAAVRHYREGLIHSDYRAGCPVMAVAVEAGDHDNRTAAAVERAAVAFDRWSDLLTQRLVSDGVPRKKATELATLVIASLEGALVLARAARDVTPLDRVHRQLHSLLMGEKTKGKR